jgi:hypothetical protein
LAAIQLVKELGLAAASLLVSIGLDDEELVVVDEDE